MTRTTEVEVEEKERRRRMDIAQACLGGLDAAVDRMGGELTGISLKTSDWDVLATLRADFPGGRMVAFVGGSSIGEVLRKAMYEGRRDGLRWKPCKYSD